MVTLAARVLEAVAPFRAGPVVGLPGAHNLAFWAVPGDGADRIVLPRHEQAAVYAADGAARATGRLGVALTTTGPGAANAVAAFGEAASARSPVLLVASEVATGAAGRPVLHAMPGGRAAQSALFAPLAKAVFAPRTVAEAVAATAAAIGAALAPPTGPVYLGLPTDLLGREAPPVPVPRQEPPAHPAAEEVAAAARLLGAAGRVVVWAGGGAVDCGPALGALARLLGAPVLTSFAGRGVLPPDDPLLVGLPPHEPAVAALLAEADALLVVGSELDGMATRNWALPRPPTLVRVDVDPARLHDPWPADAAVAGDAAAVLPALAGAVSALPGAPAVRGAAGQAAALGALRERVREGIAADPATAEAALLVRAVEAAADAGATVVCDMSVAGYWVGGYARVPGPRRLLYPIGWGTLGFGLPAAVGVAATGRPALAVCGDAGALFAVAELATAVQERLPLTVLVVDDGGYGMLRYDQDRAGDPRHGVDLTSPDFVALARGFGVPAERVPDVGGPLRDALAAAVTAGASRLVTVRAALHPPRTTSPRWSDAG